MRTNSESRRAVWQVRGPVLQRMLAGQADMRYFLKPCRIPSILSTNRCVSGQARIMTLNFFLSSRLIQRWQI